MPVPSHLRHPRAVTTIVTIVATLGLSCAPAHAAPSAPASRPPVAATPDAAYVALGSSYAAGGGLPPVSSTGLGGPCGRSTIAYPSLVASALRLQLTNAACGGATIANIASTPQRIYAPDGSSQVGPLQLDAVGPDTDLVTITVGGNDVNYVGNLIAEACLGDLATDPASVISNQLKQYGLCTPLPDATVRQRLTTLADSYTTMVRMVQQRAPYARIVLVDYVTVLPENGKPCAAMPIPQERQRVLLSVAKSIDKATKVAARRTGAELLAASKLSRGHDVCSGDPWVRGYDFSPGVAAMHPNQDGHAAVAAALTSQLIAA
jgi:lysophospholipase L1-like esterase